jgi:hypothetical protein
MKKLVRESLNEIRKDELLLKSIKIGIISKIENWCKEYHINSYDLNDDFEINAETVNLPNGTEIPDFIRFNEVGRFTLKNLDVPPNKLGDIIPKKITHSLNIETSRVRYTIRDVMKVCELSPTATLVIDPSFDNKDALHTYKLRRKPKRSERVDNIIPPDDPTRKKIDHSYGFNTYSALKFIQAAGEKGRSYTDIVAHVYNLSYPNMTLPTHSGYWSSAFSQGGYDYFENVSRPVGQIVKYTNKIPSNTGKRMRYVINDAGKQYIEDHKAIFER